MAVVGGSYDYGIIVREIRRGCLQRQRKIEPRMWAPLEAGRDGRLTLPWSVHKDRGPADTLVLA